MAYPTPLTVRIRLSLPRSLNFVRRWVICTLSALLCSGNPIESIATSSGQSDSGLFELNFRDERYLPFEGLGAIGTWQLELPAAFRQFDYDSISDVVLHLRYTASDGGAGFRTLVEQVSSDLLNEQVLAAGRDGLYQAYDLRTEFPDQWAQLKQTASAQLTLGEQYLPYVFRRHAPAIDRVTWFAKVTGAPAAYAMAVDATPFNLSRNATLAQLCVGTSAAIGLGTSFDLSAADPLQLEGLTMLVHYTINP